MKKLLFLAIGALMFLCTEAIAAPCDVGWQQHQSVTCYTDGMDTQPVQQVFAYVDYVIEAPAQADVQYFPYWATPAESARHIFDMALPVFRLCNGKSFMFCASTLNRINSNATVEGLRGCLSPNSRARHVSV